MPVHDFFPVARCKSFLLLSVSCCRTPPKYAATHAPPPWLRHPPSPPNLCVLSLLLFPSQDMPSALTPCTHAHLASLCLVPFATRLSHQAVLTKRIAAAAASTLAVTRPLLSELNPILRPLVSGMKKEPDAQRRQRR